MSQVMLRVVNVTVSKSFDGVCVRSLFFRCTEFKLHISNKVPKRKPVTFSLSGNKYKFGAERFIIDSFAIKVVGEACQLKFGADKL